MSKPENVVIAAPAGPALHPHAARIIELEKQLDLLRMEVNSIQVELQAIVAFGSKKKK